MTSMILEVYDAFRSIGIDDDKARAAAGALSGPGERVSDLKSEMDRRFDEVDRRFDQVDRRFEKMQSDIDRRFEKMQSDIDRRFDQTDLKTEKRFSKLEADTLLLKWMIGVMFAGVASLVAKAFF